MKARGERWIGVIKTERRYMDLTDHRKRRTGSTSGTMDEL